MSAPTLDQARALDAADPLASFRDRFVIGTGPDDPVAYLDGNSLGRLPVATVERLRRVVDQQWGSRLIRSWMESWVPLPEQVGDLIGRSVLGAAPGQVVVADSTSVNIAKVLHAAAGRKAARSSPTAATSRPTATCSRGSPRSADWSYGSSTASRRPRRCRAAPATWSCSRTSATAAVRSRTWRRSSPPRASAARR